MEELYVEVIYELLHRAGCCDNENDVKLRNVFSYLQDAFKFSQEKHEKLLSKAKSRDAPEFKLHVEIIEVKDLNSKDSNALANSFVTIYFESKPENKFYSSVKLETLSAKWKEQFTLKIPGKRCRENLLVELWHVDNIFSFTNISSWKYENNLLGQENIPLKSIPSSGLTTWYNLEKKNKKTSQGSIKIKMNFSSEKNHKEVIQEHRYLLRLLLQHELKLSKCAPYWWAGKFGHEAEKVLEQHSALYGLTQTDIAFAAFSVFTEIHLQHPLSFSLFENLIEKLVKPVQTRSFPHEEELNIFWDAAKRILPLCFSVIRKIRTNDSCDKISMKMLQEVLSIISKVSMLEPPEGTKLFPEDSYGWFGRPNSLNIREALSNAIESGAADWFNSILDADELNGHNDEAKLHHVMKITQLIQIDVKKAAKFYDRLFHQFTSCSYSKTSLKSLQRELSKVAQPIVECCCNVTRIIELPESRLEDFTMGTELFKYYRELKEFAVFSTSICFEETNFEFAHWFSAGVPHWFDVAASKALIHIEKSIELDELIPVDESVKHSSSAFDTSAVFNDIQIFWQQLDWPHVETASDHISKSFQDICNCCEFYAEKIITKLDSSSEIEKWCCIVNNIEYIVQSIESLSTEWNMALDQLNLSNFVQQLIVKVVKSMAPNMKNFLIGGVYSNSMDELMMYLEETLRILNSELNKVNFEKFLNTIWVELSSILLKFVEKCIGKQKPVQIFSILNESLNDLIECFYSSYYNNLRPDLESLRQAESILKIHSIKTSELIQQYCLGRYYKQKQTTESPYGVLTVKCYFIGNLLEIEILNCRNLLPIDQNSHCDSFVKIHLLPEDKFPSFIKKKTQVQFETLFPLFDEKFTIELTPDQRDLNDALIMFSVKDFNYFGMFNHYLGDCFIKFSDIVDITADSGSIQQIHMTLTTPENVDLDSIHVLESRQSDKQAREFVRNLKSRVAKVR